MQYVELHSSASLHKIRQPDRFDLVIVDEAHKFRNDTADAISRSVPGWVGWVGKTATAIPPP